MYKTRVITYPASMIRRAKLVEDTANEMAAEGYRLISVTSTGSGAILVFYKAATQEER